MSRPQPLITARDDLVEKVLEGWVLAYRDHIHLNADGHVVRTKQKALGKVALVIGNGTGHEPAMVGFVGEGLMDLNVPGPIFAAPDAVAISKGVLAADRGAGVLLCVSNHQGDVLAAELAVELLEDADEAPRVEIAVLGEDIGSNDDRSDRRGGAGLLFVWKLLGAYAEQGHSLSECHELALRVTNATASLSAVVAVAHHPLSGAALGSIPEGKVAIGSGVHGEGSGIEDFVSVEHLVESMIGRLRQDPVIGSANRVAVVLNNMGRLTGLELGYLVVLIRQELEQLEVVVERIWFGQYATTQDAAGFAIAICAVDDELLALYDAPAGGASWASR